MLFGHNRMELDATDSSATILDDLQSVLAWTPVEDGIQPPYLFILTTAHGVPQNHPQDTLHANSCFFRITNLITATIDIRLLF
jgi:hypothetical protein